MSMTSSISLRWGTIAAAVLTVVAVSLTPDLPWYAGPVALGLAGVAFFDRHWLWAALGAALLWVPAAAGPAGVVVLGGAVLLGALRWRSLGTLVVATGLALAGKQWMAASVLPAALEVVPWILVSTVTAAGAVSAARGGRVEAAGLALAGGILLARLGFVWSVEGVARVEAAARIGAVPLVYEELAWDPTPALAEALLRASPDRDEAALALGWSRALDLGWRPARAEGVVLEVARALDARGRGGEALRLLARHPRVGDVDALRALLERVQGVPVRWRGAQLGPTLPGGFEPGVEFETNGWASIELTATEPLPGLVLVGEGTAYAGAPVLEVRLDARDPVDWALDGPAELVLPGPIDAGPHRIGLRFVNDRADAGGDRNARVLVVHEGGAADPSGSRGAAESPGG